jgi:cell shape-determining protein MreD
MSWSLYLFALVGITILQGGLINQVDLRVGGIQPIDLFLMLMLAYALRVPGGDARLAAFGIGLMQDLCGLGPIGAGAISFGLAASLLVLLRENIRTTWWIARFVLALTAAVLAQTLISTYALVWLQSAAGVSHLVLMTLVTATVAALVTASLPTADHHRSSAGFRGR